MREHFATVPEEAAGTRLDRWLTDTLDGLSRARLQGLIAEGAVTRAGQPVTDAAVKVKAGEIYTVDIPAPTPLGIEAQAIALDVVFEDDELIVVNKPAGLVVHPAAGSPDHTLVNALLAHCGDSLRGIGGVARPGIVHRIDKDTSGLIVAAKSEQAHAGLAAQFAAHDIDRHYDAVVWGIPSPRKGTIVGAIGRSPHNRQKMAIVRRGGKEAETSFLTRATFGTVAALVECRLMTGRTHQIRVHMSSRGHPLIGDPVYGGGRKLLPKTAPADVLATVSAFKRQALHAATLGFVHPLTGEELRFERPPPADFAALVAALHQL